MSIMRISRLNGRRGWIVSELERWMLEHLVGRGQKKTINIGREFITPWSLKGIGGGCNPWIFRFESGGLWDNQRRVFYISMGTLHLAIKFI
jgi:hypothetical protein